jgi:hypothetical protein
MDTDVQEVWLTREQVAQRLQMPVKTVAEWGRAGYGPPYAVMGRHCRYPLDRLLDWEQARLNEQSQRNASNRDRHIADAAGDGDHHDD